MADAGESSSGMSILFALAFKNLGEERINPSSDVCVTYLKPGPANHQIALYAIANYAEYSLIITQRAVSDGIIIEMMQRNLGRIDARKWADYTAGLRSGQLIGTPVKEMHEDLKEKNVMSFEALWCASRRFAPHGGISLPKVVHLLAHLTQYGRCEKDLAEILGVGFHVMGPPVAVKGYLPGVFSTGNRIVYPFLWENVGRVKDGIQRRKHNPNSIYPRLKSVLLSPITGASTNAPTK